MNKSPEQIYVRILSEAEEEIARIFASSLALSEDWRIANVVPLFMKGSAAKSGNYRQMRLTSVARGEGWW